MSVAARGAGKQRAGKVMDEEMADEGNYFVE